MIFSEPGGEITNVNWSVDSRYLIFQTDEDFANRSNGIGDWYRYDRESGVIVQSDMWPLLPQLTPQQRQVLHVGMSNGDDAFMYLSPDGRYLAYIERFSRNLAIADLQTMQFYNTSLPVNYAFTNTENYHLVWSQDGSTVIVENLASALPSPLAFIVYIDAADIGNSQSQQFVPSIQGWEYVVTDAFDLTVDGSQFIFNGYGLLAILTQDNPANSRILNENNSHIAATFSANNETIVIAVRDDGLIAYDLNTNQETILRPDINSTEYSFALFSPDGRWVALAAEIDVATEGLYVFELTIFE